MRKAGYIVPSWTDYFKYCCACCWGPFMRRRWESDHLYFRNAYPTGNASQRKAAAGCRANAALLWVRS